MTISSGLIVVLIAQLRSVNEGVGSPAVGGEALNVRVDVSRIVIDLSIYVTNQVML